MTLTDKLPENGPPTVFDRRRALGLAGWLGLCLGVGGLGAWATNAEIPTWYATLSKPDWTPPNAVFGPVWTTLYLMMGVAAWLVWRRVGFRGGALALTLFGVQLALNSAWSFLFFNAHRPDWAFADIIALWLAIVATIIAFARHSRPAAALLIPYLLWVSYAAALNWAIARLNP